MDFLLDITKIWQKSRDFWFAAFFLEIFKIHRLVWIFLWILVVLNLVLINILLKDITNFKFNKSSFIKDYHWKHILIIGCVLCAKEIHRI
jgi:hypothetical protein